MEELTGKQRRYLRGLANVLRPSVYVGREGISPSLLDSCNEAYGTRELLKIKLERSCPVDRKSAGRQLADATQSHLVQILGNTVVLYRPHPEEPELQLPS